MTSKSKVIDGWYHQLCYRYIDAMVDDSSFVDRKVDDESKVDKILTVRVHTFAQIRWLQFF